jgi:hypothetical protein
VADPTQVKSLLDTFAPWVPVVTFLYLGVKAYFEIKNKSADTKNKNTDTRVKELDAKLKELELADRQKPPAETGALEVSDPPEYVPVSPRAWRIFLGFAALNISAFAFIALTQPPTMFNLGFTEISILAAGLSIGLPILATVSRTVTYNREVQNWCTLRLTFANIRLMQVQASLAKGNASLAKAQIESTNELISELLSQLRRRLTELGDAMAKVDLHALNAPLPGLVERFKQGLEEAEVHLEKLRAHVQKINVPP